MLKVGKNKIVFDSERLADIKEAITKQDIKDLHTEGIISIKSVKGRKKIKKRKTRRGPGKIKKTIKKRKQVYVKITRKLREYLKELKSRGTISNELFIELRKKIRMRAFRSKAHLKESLKAMDNFDFDKVKPKLEKEKESKPKESKKKMSKETKK